VRRPSRLAIGRSIAIALTFGVLASGGPLTFAGPTQAAAPAATIKAKTFTLAPFVTADAMVSCGKGKRALGGGLVQSGTAEGLWIRASGPLDATGITLETRTGDVPKQWYAAVQNTTDDTRTLKVFAICAKGTDATLKARTLTLAPQALGEATLSCGKGKRALGGGVVQSGAPGFLWLRASGPLDATGITSETRSGDVPAQWYGAISNRETVPRTVKVFAICAGGTDARIKAAALPAPEYETTEAFAVCASGRRALGGGLVQSGDTSGMYIGANGPLDATGITLESRTGDVAKQWYAAVDNKGATDKVYKVFAICA
jgi:hypothetical protein